MTDTSQKTKKEYFKKSYEFVCCKCKHVQHAAPSIMMKGFGMNSGLGNCINCKELLHLEIEGGLDGEKIISTLWDDFLKKENVRIKADAKIKDFGKKKILPEECEKCLHRHLCLEYGFAKDREGCYARIQP